jgi:Domain of unknown function (DUF1707)
MNTSQTRYPGYPAPQLKASDADRDAVVSALSEHYQAGRLTTEELEDRTGQALAARTYGDLAALTADLPGPVPSAGPGPVSPAPAPGGGLRVRGALAIAVAVVAVIAVADLAFSFGTGHHSAGFWWIIPVALLVVRRRALRVGGFRGRGRF